MGRNKATPAVAAAAVLLALGGASEAEAQQDLTGPAGPDWRYRATIYGWLPALDTSIGTDFGTVDSSLDTGEVLDALDFAFMGVFEAQRGRWSFIGDYVYSTLSSEEDTPFGVLFSEAEVETELSALTAYAAYRVASGPQTALDLGAGFRWFSLDADTTLRGAARPTERANLSDDWADPVLMARGIVAFDERWFATGLVDVGGSFDGDSETWQALASLNYAFNETWSLNLAYRWMSLDREIDGKDVGLDLFGPLIGVSARF